MKNALLPLLLMLLLSGCSMDAFSPQFLPDLGFKKHAPVDIQTHVRSSKTMDRDAALHSANLWDRIIAGFAIDYDDNNPRIAAQVKFFAAKQGFLDRTVDRATPYLYYIVEQLEKQGLPLELALLPIVESAYDPFAYSRSQAAGIWQFIPSTAKLYDLKQNWWYDARRDIVEETAAAISYLDQAHTGYKGDWALAIASYNYGGGNIGKAIKKNEARRKPTNYWSLDLPEETDIYVPRLLALAKMLRDPEKYGVTFKAIPNRPYFSIVNTGSQIDLAQAAELAGIDIMELYMLNPGFNRWATDPDGPHRLLIPVANAQRFSQGIASLPAGNRIHWTQYTVGRSDSLASLAAKFDTTTEALKAINNIRGGKLRTGQSILIPATPHRVSLAKLESSSALQEKQSTVITSDKSSSKKSDKTIAKTTSTAKATTAVTSSKKKTAAKASTTRKISYKVRKGDSLARIASRFSVSVDDLMKWNHIKTTDKLQLNQIITISSNVR